MKRTNADIAEIVQRHGLDGLAFHVLALLLAGLMARRKDEKCPS